MNTSRGLKRIIQVIRGIFFIWLFLLAIAIAWLTWDYHYGNPPLHLDGFWILVLWATSMTSFVIGSVVIWVLEGFADD